MLDLFIIKNLATLLMKKLIGKQLNSTVLLSILITFRHSALYDRGKALGLHSIS